MSRLITFAISQRKNSFDAIDAINKYSGIPMRLFRIRILRKTFKNLIQSIYM